MAQPIAPEVWQEGIADNRLLPGRRTNGFFTGSGVKIANNAQACRVWDINVSDYITDYDDRRLNGLEGNKTGNDGWAASAWGVFQDVRFTSRVYTMGRHRSTALRVFEEMQYDGEIGAWGDATKSNVITNGEALMKVAAIISKAKQLWQDEVLDPDIDIYNLFAICSGHISGRAVGRVIGGVNHNDHIFDGDADHYQWVAQPGMMQGAAIPPRFAPIHGIQWDDENVTQLLQNIKVTWNNLNIPQENRVILLDPFYEIKLMRALTGAGIPATEAAYTDVQNGSFTRLMGWDFDFSIPTNYWPKLYFDQNLNVCHGYGTDSGSTTVYTANTADDAINSIAGDNSGAADHALLQQLLAADRMNELNFVRTVWVPTSGTTPGHFGKVVSNYPLGQPAFNGYYGQNAVELVGTGDSGSTHGLLYPFGGYNGAIGYPWNGQGAGYGLLPYANGSSGDKYATGAVGSPAKKQVIGLALYKPSAQLSQEYSEMRTEDGGTRGKFTEMVFDIKYDAWVIERLACGILPIVAPASSTAPQFGLPVSIVSNNADPTLVDVTIAKSGSSSSTKLTATPKFNVNAANNPAVTYAWKKGDTAVDGATNEITIGTATGTWTCTATSNGKSVVGSITVS